MTSLEGMIAKYFWKLAIIDIAAVIGPCLSLPSNIRVAAMFDKEGDEKHVLAFNAAIDNINDDRNWLLRGIILEPEVIKVPYGDRYFQYMKYIDKYKI